MLENSILILVCLNKCGKKFGPSTLCIRKGTWRGPNNNFAYSELLFIVIWKQSLYKLKLCEINPFITSKNELGFWVTLLKKLVCSRVLSIELKGLKKILCQK